MANVKLEASATPDHLCKAQDRCGCLLQGLLQHFHFPLGKQGSRLNCSHALYSVCRSKAKQPNCTPASDDGPQSAPRRETPAARRATGAPSPAQPRPAKPAPPPQPAQKPPRDGLPQLWEQSKATPAPAWRLRTRACPHLRTGTQDQSTGHDGDTTGVTQPRPCAHPSGPQQACLLPPTCPGS